MTPLRVRALTKAFPPDLPVLRGIDLVLAAGEMGLILGANGAGKSTLLRCCSGCLRATQGAIEHHGGVAYLGEADYLYADATVGENLRLAATLTRRTGDLSAVAEEWQVGGWWNRRCGELSFGQRRRVALARIWLVGRDLLCLDEPLRGLDDEAVAICSRAAARVAEYGGTVLLASQSPDGLGQLATHRWRLHDGRLRPERP